VRLRLYHMSRLIYTYAMIKSLHDMGKDYLDSFWPFILGVLPRKNAVAIGDIKGNLKSEYELNIPYLVLRSLLERMTDLGYIEKTGDPQKCKVTDSGIKYQEKLYTEKEVRRKIMHLINDIQEYFANKGINKDDNEIENMLLSFLQENLDPLIEFINPSEECKRLIYDIPEEELLAEYITIAESRKPDQYSTIENLVQGSIISVILHAKKPSDIVEISKKSFSNCRIYLDTNFIFSKLGMHDSEFSVPAKELFDLLKKFGFGIRVFDFTVSEMCSLLMGFESASHQHLHKYDVHHIYSHLRRENWTKIDVQNFITNIEDKLRNEGIQIEYTDINLGSYEPFDKNIRSYIDKYKQEKATFSKNHDIAAIERIKEIRVRPIRKIEESRACFLTSDVKLHRLNYYEMGHKESGTICEVILDRLLANILWLKDPSSIPPVKSIIAIHSRYLFIDRQVWNKFYDLVIEIKKNGRISDKEISALFYQNYIEEVLVRYDETETDKISEEFVVKEIMKANESLKFEMEKKIRDKENQILKNVLAEEKANTRKIKEKIDRDLKIASEELAGRYIKAIKATIGIILLLPVLLCFVLRETKIFYLIISIIPFCLLLISIVFGPIERIWESTKIRLENGIYNRRKTEINWDEIELVHDNLD
jgi:hypothetical protein